MERAYNIGDNFPEDKTRRALAVGFTLAVHGFIFVTLSFVPQKQLAILKAPIPVNLVIVETNPPIKSEPKSEPEPNPAKETPVKTQSVSPPVEPSIRSLSDPTPPLTPPPQPQPQPETLVDDITPEPLAERPPSEPLSIISTQDSQLGEPIPRGKTEPPRNPNYEALTQALDCLGFDEACAEQRKAVFSEDQLTETDLVWMPSFAHSGLSNSDFYGLSEAQIRDRLGVATAGKNGFAIFPGISIDGPLWDALHGVNKACDYGIGGTGAERRLVKRCDTLKPSSRDRIRFIPKPAE